MKCMSPDMTSRHFYPDRIEPSVSRGGVKEGGVWGLFSMQFNAINRPAIYKLLTTVWHLVFLHGHLRFVIHIYGMMHVHWLVLNDLIGLGCFVQCTVNSWRLRQPVRTYALPYWVTLTIIRNTIDGGLIESLSTWNIWLLRILKFFPPILHFHISQI